MADGGGVQEEDWANVRGGISRLLELLRESRDPQVHVVLHVDHRGFAYGEEGPTPAPCRRQTVCIRIGGSKPVLFYDPSSIYDRYSVCIPIQGSEPVRNLCPKQVCLRRLPRGFACDERREGEPDADTTFGGGECAASTVSRGDRGGRGTKRGS